ncbi:hypothetical protein Tco_1020727 [Tanacetum coccineum]
MMRIRVCLLLALDFVFMGQELRHRDYNVVADLNRRKYHLDKLASNSKYEANYVLYDFVFPLKIILKKVTPSTPVLRSSTKSSSNSKSVHTRVRTEVRHEVHVRTEVCRFVDKKEVRTQAVDQEDFLERVVLAQTVKDQQQMIVDLQCRLLSVEQVTKKLCTGPSDVDHLDKNDNQYDNFPVGGLDHQSMDGVCQCMNVDRLISCKDGSDNVPVNGLDHQSMERNCKDSSDNFPIDGLDHQSMKWVSHYTSADRLDKNCNNGSDNFPVDGLDHQSMKGVNHCTSVDHISQRLNEVDESVAIDGLIRLRSQDVDHTSKESLVVDDNDFNVKDNKEADFLSTQQVRELMKDVFDTPSGPNSIQDVGGSESMNVDQPYLVKNVKDVDESDIKTVVVPFQQQKFPGKVLVSPYVPLQSTEVKCNKRRRELKLNKSKRVIKTIIDSDGNQIQLLPWTEDLTHYPNAPKRTVTMPEPILSLFRDKNRMELREPNDDWAMASPYLSDMLSRYELPLYYADGVKYGLP